MRKSLHVILVSYFVFFDYAPNRILYATDFRQSVNQWISFFGPDGELRGDFLNQTFKLEYVREENTLVSWADSRPSVSIVS